MNDAWWRLTTRAVVCGRPDPVPDAPMSVPVVASSTYAAGGQRGYGRYGNPTWEAFEQAVGALEGGTCVAFASGMAAVSAVVTTLLRDSDPQQAIVVPQDGYHTAVTLLSGLGRPIRSVSVADTDAVVDAVAGAALLWVESPTNPLLQVPDLPAVVAAAREAGAAVVVDATAATPLLLRPLELDVDAVVHAATKMIAGHSDVLVGVVSTGSVDLVERLRAHRALHGAVPGSFETWLALRGLRTLPVRLERAQASAVDLAHRLTAHPTITRVRYPGLASDPGYDRARLTMDGPGVLVAIEVDGGAAAADRVCAATRLWVQATSFGGVESLLERRRRWPSERDSVPESLIRLSVGLEDVDDLWDDLDAALTRA